MKLRIYFDQQPWQDLVRVFIVGQTEGKTFVVKPMELIMETTAHDPANRMEPSLQLQGEFAREFLPALSDALNASGFKGVESPDTSELKATKYHLEDMRKIVFEPNEPVTYTRHEVER